MIDMRRELVEPGDDARAAERVVVLLEDFAVRFDPVDRIRFYSEIVRRLVSHQDRAEDSDAGRL
jgi:hypothetical protein